jgi:hypothetical protein
VTGTSDGDAKRAVANERCEVDRRDRLVHGHGVGIEVGPGAGARLGPSIAISSRLPSMRPALVGNGENPQLPVTSVVTPCKILLSALGSSSDVTSEWVWMSMKPGATTWPLASIVVSLSTSSPR